MSINCEVFWFVVFKNLGFVPKFHIGFLKSILSLTFNEANSTYALIL